MTVQHATSPDGVRQLACGVAALMRGRLGARGADLAETLHHSGHRLPRGVRREAAYLARCAEEAGHPALFARLDTARVQRAEAACRRHLGRIGRWSRRGATALSVLRRVAGVGLAAAALALGLALWRGLI